MPCLSRPPYRARLIAPALSRPPYRARLIALINCLLLVGMLSLAHADAPAAWDANAQGQFITSLCQDNAGRVWIGTEDQGVWRFDPSASIGKQYSHFTTKDGLGDDNAYALACDKAGRIWLGSLNHGVSVFNGKQWKTYGPLDGPLGSRVFALAVSPTDGGVWGATEAGLFRYQNSHWTYFTRADGLPSDQANALAFGPDGTLYVGTQADGIAIASPDDNYKSWRIVSGPNQMPSAATGTGLPSALINCLLITQNGTVYAGTDGGLAASRDGGLTWRYQRGVDWKAKLAGLYHPVTPSAAPFAGDLLSEDYVTSLAEGTDGRLFIGHRQTGVEAFDPKTGKRMQSGANGIKTDDYVNCLLTTGTNAWVGLYGGGLHPPTDASADASVFPSASSASIPPLPVPAKPPTLAELNTMLRVVSAVAPNKDELAPKVVALDDDWVTEGDWLGRYGRYWACLCAMSNAPFNSIWGAGRQNVDYRTRIGPNCRPHDKLRYHVTWSYTTNPRTLELPPTYLDSRVRKKLTTWNVNRRQSEVDDHGETYPMNQDGPHVYCNLTVPTGLFYLSLYDFNKDGHIGLNRFRDFRLSLRPLRKSLPLKNTSYFDQQPELAQSRIRNFWGGVWKRFLVRGPLLLGVEVNRNNSYCTILSAVTLDPVEEEPSPYFGHLSQKREMPLAQTRKPTSEIEEANRLFDKLAAVRQTNPVWWAVNGGRYYLPLLRWYRAHSSPSGTAGNLLTARLGTCYYQAGMFAAWEACQNKRGLTSARQIEKQLRWDGVTDIDHDYDVVTQFLADHPAIKNSNYYVSNNYAAGTSPQGQSGVGGTAKKGRT